MGRHRKPIEQLKREGTYRGDRHSGPEPEIMPPEKPAGLQGVSGEFWELVSPAIKQMGVYTEADQQSLKLLCEAYQNYSECKEQIESDGRFITRVTKSGESLVEHPAGRAMSRHLKEILYLMRKFGMTPSDRTGLHVGDKEDKQESDLEKLLGGGRLN